MTAFKAKRKIELDGQSSTGSRHGLLIEEGEESQIRFTVTGANGKRHASVLIDTYQVDLAFNFLGSA